MGLGRNEVPTLGLWNAVGDIQFRYCTVLRELLLSARPTI